MAATQSFKCPCYVVVTKLLIYSVTLLHWIIFSCTCMWVLQSCQTMCVSGTHAITHAVMLFSGHRVRVCMSLCACVCGRENERTAERVCDWASSWMTWSSVWVSDWANETVFAWVCEWVIHYYWYSVFPLSVTVSVAAMCFNVVWQPKVCNPA